jgi:hypothetical protein
MNQNIRAKTILEKALEVNLDPLYYGTFAEIGAGQEVARHFFQAGKASQTVALTISAYDMTYSDIIYGKEKNGRYVCLPRLNKMLDREYEKLLERLGPSRKDNTCFFSFADTVATNSGNDQKSCHGWMGIKFQTHPNSDSSEIKLHVRMLDKHRLHQQETLSKLGVNLIHSAFYYREDTNKFLEGLFDQIKQDALAVDVVYFSGPGFIKVDEVHFNLMLVERGYSQACLIDENGKAQNPQDYLWGKSLLIQRGFFQPVTNTHLDIFTKGKDHFKKEFKVKDSDLLGIFEFTIDNRIKKTHLSAEQALQRVQVINQIKTPVLVTGFTFFYQLKEFIRLSSSAPLAIVIGATHLEKLFDESYYTDLKGGLLEGMSKLLGRFSRLYIYPHKTQNICLMTKSFFPQNQIRHIYNHYLENNQIQDIAGCDELNEFIHSDDVIDLIKKKDLKWKSLVPKQIHQILEKQFL